MGFGPFSSSSDTRSRITNVNSSINQAEGAQAFTPRINTGKGSASAAITQSGIAVQGRNNAVTVTTTDFGAIATAGAVLDRALQSQANLSLEAVGFARELAETKVSDGANITSKTTRIALYALAAIVAVFFIFRR
jgi:hypothetical protein